MSIICEIFLIICLLSIDMRLANIARLLQELIEKM